MQLGSSTPDTRSDLQARFDAQLSAVSSGMTRLGVAVSGGSDSIAMLLLAVEFAKARGVSLSVATVNHGLREEAAEEADFVARLCGELELPHQVLVWDTPASAGNIQSLARAARYDLLAKWAQEQRLEAVALGHTRDDQAENFLIRLARGSGLDGLAGIVPSFKSGGVTFLRPMLTLGREELRDNLRQGGQEWRDDPSNENLNYKRIQARKALDLIADIGIDRERIAETAARLGDAKQALQHAVLRDARAVVTFNAGDILIDRAAFGTLHKEVQRRILGAALMYMGQSDYPPRSDAVLGVLERLIEQEFALTLNHCLLSATQGSLRVGREPRAVANKKCGTTQIWDGRWRLAGPHSENLYVSELGNEGLRLCPDWQASGLPRSTLIASPAVWNGAELIAAPLAGFCGNWSATLTRGEKQFFSSIVTH